MSPGSPAAPAPSPGPEAVEGNRNERGRGARVGWAQRPASGPGRPHALQGPVATAAPRSSTRCPTRARGTNLQKKVALLPSGAQTPGTSIPSR